MTKKQEKDTNKDLNDKIDKILIKQINVESELKNVKENMMTKEDKSEILNVANEIKKKFDDHKTEHAANQAAHDRFEERITTVEKKVGIAA